MINYVDVLIVSYIMVESDWVYDVIFIVEVRGEAKNMGFFIPPITFKDIVLLGLPIFLEKGNNTNFKINVFEINNIEKNLFILLENFIKEIRNNFYNKSKCYCIIQ